MNEENKQLLLDELSKDFVKKNKIICIGCLAGAVFIAILSIITNNYLFSLIAIPFIFVALFAFKNSKKYSNPDTINNLVFSEEICISKASELSTTGNIRYLEFSNNLRYDISFSEGSMYNDAHIGSHFYVVSDPKKNCILKLILVPGEKNSAEIRENLIKSATEAVLNKDILPGLTVSLKNMMDLNEHPIVVCNQLHQIFYLNTAAKNQFSSDESIITNHVPIFNFIPEKELISIQKAMLQFSEKETCNKVAGWQKDDGKEIEIFALRNNANKLSGYYLQEK